VAQSIFELAPGASAFLDADWDSIRADEKTRHQIRAVATILDDPEFACIVTLELFDKDTGKTTLFMEVPDATRANLRSRGYQET
jgi:hypothetical protein